MLDRSGLIGGRTGSEDCADTEIIQNMEDLRMFGSEDCRFGGNMGFGKIGVGGCDAIVVESC